LRATSPVLEDTGACFGHDLSKGTAVFVKAARPDRPELEQETDQVMKELLHEPGIELPQLDSFGQRRGPSTAEAGSRVA
jgi:hypothetical protein